MKRIVLQTERMILREFEESDIDALAQILANPLVMKFSPTGALSVQMTAEKVRAFIDSYRQYSFGKWAVIKREQARLIGYCGIAVEYLEGREEKELGYRFDPHFWGIGLATEAASACLKYAFDTLHLDYLLGS